METKPPTQTETPPPSAALPVESVSAESLALPLATNMPEPTPGAVKDALPATAPNAEPTHAQPAPRIESAVRDRGGKAFDPALYKQNPDGSPRTDKNGYFISHTKGQKGPKDPNAPVAVKSVMPEGTPKAATSTAVIPPGTNADKGPDEFDAAAELYFNMLIPIFCGVISPEWQPGFFYDENGKGLVKDAKQEKDSIVIPLAAYMRANGKVEIPPGWALVLSVGAYGGKRTMMPQTQAKIESGFSRVKRWFGFGKK